MFGHFLTLCMKGLNENFSIKIGMARSSSNSKSLYIYIFCRAVRIAAMPAIGGILEAIADKGV